MFSKLISCFRLNSRYLGTISLKEYQCKALDRAVVEKAVKKLYAEHASIPVVVGNEMIFTGDEQHLRMPHNHQRIATKFYYATQNHIKFAIERALCVQETWGRVDAQQRSEIFNAAAELLFVAETRAELVAAIMLNQAKTRLEAENDVCKMILMIRKFAEGLINLSKFNPLTATANVKSSYLLRPLDGFVAACGPLYMSWNASYLALSPLIMGNAVVWRPPPNYVHAAFILFKAFMEAGVPCGAFQFMPSNYKLFLNTVIKSNDLAGINYAGRVSTLRELWHYLSIQLPHYKCFPRLCGECDSKGYHFVHESADLDIVVNCTIEAAFCNSGQRTHSCGRLYVPDSLWPDLYCKLKLEVENIKIGDPTDEKTYASAIMREDIYDNICSHLTYAKASVCCDILLGGNFTKTHGFFIEPTIIECKNPSDRIMIEEIMGPVICVYVYESNNLQKALEALNCTQKFGSSGSIFSTNSEVTGKLLNKLRMTASNLYVNEQCSGKDLNFLPLGGNRLSGTNDKSCPEFYLLRFASPQLIEESGIGCADSAKQENHKYSCSNT